MQEVGTDGSPIFYETYSHPTTQTAKVASLHLNDPLELDLDGAGMLVGVWDSGIALTTHQEYNGRAVIADGTTEVDETD